MIKKIYLFLFFCTTTASVFAQPVLVPFHLGKLWGLADTLGNIKVTPAYDEITTSSYFNIKTRTQPSAAHVFIVRKDNRYGVIRDGVMIMPAKYHKLRADSMFITEDNQVKNNSTMAGSRTMLYNYAGHLLIADTIADITQVVNAKTRGRRLFQVYGNKNNSGLFWYDPKGGKIVQWIIKGVSSVNAMPDTGHLYVAVYAANKPHQLLELVFNSPLNTYAVQPVTGYKPNYPDERPRGRGYHQTDNNFLRRHIEFRLQEGRILEVRTDTRNKERKGRSDSLSFNISCDSAALVKYMRSGSVEWHNTIPYDNQMLLDKIDTGFEYVDYVLYYKNGRKGMVAGDHVVPAAYEDIIYFKANMIDKPFFMVSELSKTTGKSLWGVINSEGKIILPVEYDEITRGNGGGSWVIKKDGLYGLTDYTGIVVIPARYEKITFDEHFFNFYIFDKGKYGYSNGEKIFCKPMFPFKVAGYDYFDDYLVYRLVDKDDKLLGYGDKKGFLYFKN